MNFCVLSHLVLSCVLLCHFLLTLLLLIKVLYLCQMVEMLAGILQTDSFDAIKFWLVNAPETGKIIVNCKARDPHFSHGEYLHCINNNKIQRGCEAIPSKKAK